MGYYGILIGQREVSWDVNEILMGPMEVSWDVNEILMGPMEVSWDIHGIYPLVIKHGLLQNASFSSFFSH